MWPGLMESLKPYPSDVSDEEWAFVTPYLALVREEASQRNHDLREVFNALRWVVSTGPYSSRPSGVLHAGIPGYSSLWWLT